MPVAVPLEGGLALPTVEPAQPGRAGTDCCPVVELFDWPEVVGAGTLPACPGVGAGAGPMPLPVEPGAPVDGEAPPAAPAPPPAPPAPAACASPMLAVPAKKIPASIAK